jgi:hypothetical protein
MVADLFFGASQTWLAREHLKTGGTVAMYPMYLVRVSFVNRHGEPFHWDFQIETDDYGRAVDEAVLTFWSGLTFEERCDAAQTFNIMAQMYYLPEPVKPQPAEALPGRNSEKKWGRKKDIE